MKNKLALILALIAIPLYAGSFELSYSDNSDNEDGFVLEVAINEGEFAEALRVEENIESMVYPVSDDVARDTVFRFRVYAFNAVGKSEPTNEVIGSIQALSEPDPASGLNIRYVDSITINANSVTVNQN